jgi:hypothetical protein
VRRSFPAIRLTQAALIHAAACPVFHALNQQVTEQDIQDDWSALYDLRKALHDAGPVPEHHRMMCQRLRDEWPVLWKALVAIVGAPTIPLNE